MHSLLNKCDVSSVLEEQSPQRLLKGLQRAELKAAECCLLHYTESLESVLENIRWSGTRTFGGDKRMKR